MAHRRLGCPTATIYNPISAGVSTLRESNSIMPAHAPPRIAIVYCTQCQWLLRAAWMAQELLSTFGRDLGEVALVPTTGGIFEITFDGVVVWERKAAGGFPDVKTLNQRVRERLDPTRDLGHLVRPSMAAAKPATKV